MYWGRKQEGWVWPGSTTCIHRQMTGRHPLATAPWTKQSGIIIFHFYHSVKSWQFMSCNWVKYYKRRCAEDLYYLKLLENVALEAPSRAPGTSSRVSSVSLSSSLPPFLSVHCQLNKSICFRRTIWKEPTVNYNTLRRETDGAVKWASGLADREFGLSETPSPPWC